MHCRDFVRAGSLAALAFATRSVHVSVALLTPYRLDRVAKPAVRQ